MEKLDTFSYQSFFPFFFFSFFKRTEKNANSHYCLFAVSSNRRMRIFGIVEFFCHHVCALSDFAQKQHLLKYRLFSYLITMVFSRRRLLPLVRKLLVTIGVVVIFTILSIFPNFSYFGEAQFVGIEGSDVFGFLWVHTSLNISYNPFLYTFSWLTGNGYYSGDFFFISKPTYYSTGGDAPAIVHRKPEDLEAEAIDHAVFRQLSINILYNFILLFILRLLNWQDFYLSMIVGAVSFSLGGLVGALAFFLPALAIVAYINLRLGGGILVRVWNLIEGRYEKPTKEQLG